MSSLLVLPPGPTDLTAIQHLSRTACYHPSMAISQLGSKSLGNLLQGGLPTPPTKADMADITPVPEPTSRSQMYPYPIQTSMPEYKNTDVQAANRSNGKSAASYAHTRSQSNGYLPAVVGARQDEQQEQQIASHLQIPASVNSSKGSLAEFAAEMTCLFWFETSSTLEYAESLLQSSPTERGLSPGATPSIGFRKWVTTILSTTQVGKNVVLLALMFIYRLKKFNPGVSGKMGSEFRLLTIALMLGNKFLDDNTYTNKTWAEVSGISVNEIHIMEVEFLSNMRYELHASEKQWQEWKAKLGRFGSFYEKAARYSKSKTTSPITPISQTFPHKLPSPSASTRYTNGNSAALVTPLHTLPQLPRSPARHMSTTDYSFERKRSLDTTYDYPPAKRLHPSYPPALSTGNVTLTPNSIRTPESAIPATPQDMTRLPPLPLPLLPISGQLNSGSVTPLPIPGLRAMGSVYPIPGGQTLLTPTHAEQLNMPHLPIPAPASIRAPSRAPSHAGSAHTSPTNLYGNSTPSRQGLSPSYFLMNRSSPYRPVRHVNTLLYPPPTSTMQNPMRPIDYQQMHYQPLSKNTNQIHSGPMPCLQPDAWQSHVSTPVNQTHHPY